MTMTDTAASPSVQPASMGNAVAKMLVTKMADFGLARFVMSPSRYDPPISTCFTED